MNEIVNTFLLARGKYLLEIHFRQPGVTYSVCGPFNMTLVVEILKI